MEWTDAALDALELARKAALHGSDAVHSAPALRKSAKQVNRAVSVHGKPGPNALLRDRPWIVTGLGAEIR